MEDLREITRLILEKGIHMSLATFDEGIWVCVISYVSDSELNIYWRSLESTRHSKALLKNKLIAGAITAHYKPDLGLQFSGIAQKITGDIPDMAEKYATKRESKPRTLAKNESWYKITPIKVDIIDEEHWGYQKKILDLQ